MELTMAQKHLIAGLKLFGVEKEAIIGIVTMLQKPEQQDELMEYMAKNKKATVSDILRKTAEIAK